MIELRYFDPIVLVSTYHLSCAAFLLFMLTAYSNNNLAHTLKNKMEFPSRNIIIFTTQLMPFYKLLSLLHSGLKLFLLHFSSTSPTRALCGATTQPCTLYSTTIWHTCLWVLMSYPLQTHEQDKMSSRIVFCVYLCYQLWAHKLLLLRPCCSSWLYLASHRVSWVSLTTLNTRPFVLGPPSIPSTSSPLLRTVPPLPTLKRSPSIVPIPHVTPSHALTAEPPQSPPSALAHATPHYVNRCLKHKYPLDENPPSPYPPTHALSKTASPCHSLHVCCQTEYLGVMSVVTYAPAFRTFIFIVHSIREPQSCKEVIHEAVNWVTGVKS